MKKVILASMAMIMMLGTSCSSSQQFYGTMTGATVGGLFGSTIGGIMGGWRGHDAGRLAGMVIGGAVGAAVTAPKTDNGEYSTSKYPSDNDGGYYTNDYDSPYMDISVDNLHFADQNNSRSLEADEHAQLVFEVRNNGRNYVYDIAPVITVTGTKHIYLSPTAIISELAPGGAVRYKAEVVGGHKLKDGNVEVTISMSDGKQMYMMRSFQLRTYKRR
ncbi:MAG: hypothetical protein KBT13_00140 [Bacteroidales bacterium]|nr:hypothetical protein [Candidatus Sodaliphilus limicaballi]